MEPQQKRITHLDGMRGIAILLVVLFHTFVRWPDLLPFVQQTKDVYLFKYGHIGVRFFFIISGFVIFMSLDRSSSMLSFFKKRWLRLFPAMLIASLFIFLTAHFFHERPAGIPHLINLIPGLTFISPEVIDSITGIRIEALEGAFWSLYVEVLFYLFAGFVYFTFGRKAILKSIFVAGFFAFSLYHFFGMTLDDRLLKFSVYVGFDSYVWFYMGCFMYEQIHKRNDMVDNIMMALAVIACLYVPHKYPGLIVMTGAIIALFCFSFYSSIIQKALNNKFLLFVGFISYPLYLIHENLIVSLSVKLINKFKIGEHGYFITVIPLAMVFFIAYVIAKAEPVVKRFLELYLNKITMKLASR